MKIKYGYKEHPHSINKMATFERLESQAKQGQAIGLQLTHLGHPKVPSVMLSMPKTWLPHYLQTQ